jgi:hypothetical protein
MSHIFNSKSGQGGSENVHAGAPGASKELGTTTTNQNTTVAEFQDHRDGKWYRYEWNEQQPDTPISYIRYADPSRTIDLSNRAECSREALYEALKANGLHLPNRDALDLNHPLPASFQKGWERTKEILADVYQVPLKEQDTIHWKGLVLPQPTVDSPSFSEELVSGKNFAKGGERIFSVPKSDAELGQDTPHLFYPPKADTYLSSNALGPCVAVFAIFSDGSMIAGHYTLSVEPDGSLSSGNDNHYARMMDAIGERAQSVGSPRTVVLAGAWSHVTDQDTGENLFPNSAEIRRGVVADMLAVGTAESGIIPLWNGGRDWMEVIVNPEDSDVLIVANGNRGLYLNNVQIKK